MRGRDRERESDRVRDRERETEGGERQIEKGRKGGES